MAPPKRKTGGRTTAPGGKPTTVGRAAPQHDDEQTTSGYSSGRYTAPISQSSVTSPQWVPTLMIGLFVLGALAIITRYLWWDSNLPMLVGIAAILGGLGVATQWK